jgi:hypothetical protein
MYPMQARWAHLTETAAHQCSDSTRSYPRGCEAARPPQRSLDEDSGPSPLNDMATGASYRRGDAQVGEDKAICLAMLK